MEYEHHWRPFIAVIYIITAVKFNDSIVSEIVRQLPRHRGALQIMQQKKPTFVSLLITPNHESHKQYVDGTLMLIHLY